jgi:hypothetical protein
MADRERITVPVRVMPLLKPKRSDRMIKQTKTKSSQSPEQDTNTNTMSTPQASAANDDSSDSSSDEELSLSTSTGANHANEMDTTQKDQVKEVEEMAKRETKNMRVWKCVVSLTVLVTASLVSTGTFVFLKSDEDSNFEGSYYSFANTIDDAVEVHKINLFTTMRSFSNIVSASAIATNSEFPFVTVPTFEVLAAAARQQSGAELIIFTPKVQVDEVSRWQEYATTNEGWYEESKQLAISSSAGSVVQSDFAPGSPLPFIYESFQDENGNPSVMPAVNNPPFYPLWQASPPPFSPILMKANIGVQPEFVSVSKAADIAREGVLGSTFFSDLYGLTGLASKAEDHEAFHDKFIVSSDTESAYTRPHAFFFQPIFREIYNDTSEIVGYINTLIPWDIYFANLLPKGVNGITCVVSDTCGQSFTYYLNGNSVSCAPFKN